MNIQDLIVLTEAKLQNLNSAVVTATRAGDTVELMRLNTDIAETQQTLDKLRAM